LHRIATGIADNMCMLHLPSDRRATRHFTAITCFGPSW